MIQQKKETKEHVDHKPATTKSAINITTDTTTEVEPPLPPIIVTETIQSGHDDISNTSIMDHETPSVTDGTNSQKVRDDNGAQNGWNTNDRQPFLPSMMLFPSSQFDHVSKQEDSLLSVMLLPLDNLFEDSFLFGGGGGATGAGEWIESTAAVQL